MDDQGDHQQESDSKGKPSFEYSDPITPEELSELGDSRQALSQSHDRMTKASRNSLLNRGSQPVGAWAKYTSLGLQMAAALIIPVLIGRWLGLRYGFDPWGIVAGFAIGAPAGMYQVIIAANRMNRADKARKAKAKAHGARGNASG